MAARDADYPAMTYFPPDPDLDAAQAAYRAAATANGGHCDAGRMLLSWANRAGFASVAPSASAWSFATPEERDLFLLLVNNVSGVGPKLALAVLNGITPVIFRGLVVAGDIASLSKIKGVGKKTAERIVVELRDKVGVSAAWEAASAANALPPEEQHVNDAVLALISLGYKQAEAHKVVRAIRDASPKATVEELVKEALKAL